MRPTVRTIEASDLDLFIELFRRLGSICALDELKGEVPHQNDDVWFIEIMKLSCSDRTNGMLHSPIRLIFIKYKLE